MAPATRRGIFAVIAAVILLALGAGLGIVVGDALGIRTEPATQMQPAAASAPPAASVSPPPQITVENAPDSPRIAAAIDEVMDATSAVATEGVASVTLALTGDGESDAYTLTGTPDALRIEAEGEAGAARGLYDIAAAVRAGTDIAANLGQTVAWELPLRIVDMGAVAVEANPEEWEPGTNYSHVSEAFRNAYIPEAPYVDDAALAADFEDWDAYLRHTVALGYNAVAWSGFIEYATFANAPEGPVYADDDEHVARALALREAFTPFWDRAEELGVTIYLKSDMLALTPELDAYFAEHYGGADTENPQLWEVYTAALDEIYADVPALAGLLIRIGEGGAIYDLPGWDYYSSLSVTTVDAVRTMLTAFTGHAEASDREIIFRTWSVGIGDVGDMHTDVASYEQVLAGIDSPALIVSTKYTLGDYYSWLPLNNTLEQGEQRRIVEFQSRREFENFGAFPNDLGTQYQWAMQQLLTANPNIEGVWVWTQDGGPWRAGPMTLYLKAGFWQLYELDTMLGAAIARDPETDVAGVTTAWARQYFSDDPETVAAIVSAMTHSREAIEQGLYIQPFADQRVFAIGLEPPPMMWIFEWDILTGDSAVLNVLYAITRDSEIGVDGAIALGHTAVESAQAMRDEITATDATTWRDREMYDAFVDTLDYEIDTLQMLASYREMVLRQAQRHDTFTAESHDQWQEARDQFVERADAHVAAYQGNVDYPAYNVIAAEQNVQRADRDLTMSWLARILLVLALAWAFIGMLAARTRLVRRPGAAAARASWLASTRPWRARESTLGMLPLDRWLMIGVPAGLLVATRLVQTSFLAWSHALTVLAAWLIFTLVVRILVGRRSPWPVIAAVGGAVVFRCVWVLFALSFTGPGGYWFAFWTDPLLRVIYITVAFALFAWVFVVAGWSLAAQLGGRRATGIVVTAVGAALLIPAAVIASFGLETALTVWNDEMGLLPWGMARILGITTFLEIPLATAWYAAGLGAALVVVGLLLSIRRRGDAPATM
ncbi:hypothetical protein [Microbacterium sp. C7(2022)]|uniref:hypothetical protein n=1 Tax=Microbacterium sp. C7(2022) TaxID=2992759 RepID=UPI00237A9554|nr:hypothetical protein [Microbacterium sp. C7(2022)]MDE0547455.1 hypothetical protein [Microbacterium sp. C7(2022)]